MKNPHLVFVPSWGAGHLTSAVEAAKLLLAGDDRLSITVLIMKLTDKNAPKLIDPLPSTRLQFINLPAQDSESMGMNLIEKFKPDIKETVSELTASQNGDTSLAGFVLDMFCTPVMDVANEFGVPSYMFFTSGASFLGFMFHLQLLHDEHQLNPTELKTSDDSEFEFPCVVNSLPVRVFPGVVLEKEWCSNFLKICRDFREAKGIMVNTFMELESHAVNYLSDAKTKAPPVYPVGPILNKSGDADVSKSDGRKEIMKWLDDQPAKSVVFLCFGSMGSLGEDQAREIASALETSGHRFLWSLRKSSSTARMSPPVDYENLDEVLPEGFLERTAGIGKIIGWAPQVAVLAHPAVGCFVSHCGWNSTLESIWYGVPIATWPMYAEQQFNAFLLVKELGLAVEITMDYRKDNPVIVRAEDIERGIRCAMEHDSEVRMKVKEMSERSRKVLMDGGSSLSSLNRLIEDVIHNMP